MRGCLWIFGLVLGTSLLAGSSWLWGQENAPQQPATAPATNVAATTPAVAGERPKVALHLGKILPSVGEPIVNGTILISNGKIEKIGPRDQIEVPAGYEVIDHSNSFAMPGMIDVHSHVGGSSDLNEMVYQTNPELRNWDQIIPHNDQLKLALAGGVTTICFIPGSGTNMGGWGVLMKTGPGKAEDVIVRAPGVLKIAQAGNPERQGGEVGSGRMGMNHVIRQTLLEGQAYVRQWDDFEAGRTTQKPAVDLRLEYFKPLFRRQIPVLVHTQQYQVVHASIAMLHDEMNLRIIIGHGTFDAFKLGEEVKKRNIPAMIGPRGFWQDPLDGQLKGIVAEYNARGADWLGVNTDAPVVPQEELFFQAAMAVRYGWTEEQALRGLTIEPARALMIDDRVGSLEVGKDADILISTGSLIDPRNYIQEVFIDGRSIYNIKKDRRRF